MLNVTIDQARNIKKLYENNPIGFFTEVLDVKPEYVWDKMVEVAEGVRDHQKVAVKAGNSLSKSYGMGRTALWFLYTHYPSTVITTAPSGTQVEEILWREIRSAYTNAKVKLGGHLTTTQLDLQAELGGDKWYAIGFATKPDTATQQATRVQGFHNHWILFIMDEGAGVVKPIWEAKDRLIITPRHKFVAIGNPIFSKGDFVDCFKDSSYHKITISVKDSPNYKADKEIIPGVAGREFEQTVIKKYGLNSNYYKAMILGEIPDEDLDTLIPIAHIEKAENRLPFPHFRFIKRFVTVDPNDGGDDDCVIKGWENKHQVAEMVIKGKKIEECEPYVWRMLREIKGNAIVYDHDGMGRVLGGYLISSADKNTTIIPFEGGAPAHDENMFFNRRAEGYWMLRKDHAENVISYPPDQLQKEELSHIKIDYMRDIRRHRIAIEKKEDIKKPDRLGHSPNLADAIMMMSACFDDVPILERKYDDSGIAMYKSRQSTGSAMAA